MIKVLHLQLYSTDFSQLNEIIKSFSSAKRYAFCRLNKDKLEFSEVRRITVKKYLNKYPSINSRYICDACTEAYGVYKSQKALNKTKNDDKIDEKSEQFKIIFGSKKEWDRYKSGIITKKEFISQRDNQLYSRGAKCDGGNGNLRILNDRLRVVIGNKHQRAYYKLFCPKKYKKDLNNLIKSGEFYNVRLLRQNKKHFEVQVQYLLPDPPIKYNYTCSLGIDFNPIEIASSLISLDGNYIETKTSVNQKIFFGSKNKKDHETGIETKKIILDASNKKALVIFEDLQFKEFSKKYIKKKSANGKRRIKINKKYKKKTRVFSKFNYSKFIKLLEQQCVKYGIPYKKVNPAYTSKIARLKYLHIFNRRIHNVAAYVIARRGLGFKEKLSLSGYNRIVLKEILLGTLAGKYKKKHFSSLNFWKMLSEKQAVISRLLTNMLVLKETSDCTNFVNKYSLEELDELDNIVQVKNEGETPSGRIFQPQQVIGSGNSDVTSADESPPYKNGISSD